MLEIMHQNNGFAKLVQFRHDSLSDLLGTPHLEVEGIKVGREDSDITLREISQKLRRMLEGWEAEIRRGRSAHRHAHGTDALLDLVLGIVLDRLDLAVDQTPAFGLRQILMTPSMRTDRVASGGDLLEDAWLVGCVETNWKEDRLGAMGSERGQHRRSVFRPRTIVEGQHHFAGPQEIVGLEVLEPKLRAAGSVNLHHP